MARNKFSNLSKGNSIGREIVVKFEYIKCYAMMGIKITFFFFLPFFFFFFSSYRVRVSPVSRKVEQKAKIPAATNLDGNLSDSNAQELSSSVTSIPDQQPAAPKVVLPVLESSASSTNVAKQVQEAEKTVEEKNGHYFMKVYLIGTKLDEKNVYRRCSLDCYSC